MSSEQQVGTLDAILQVSDPEARLMKLTAYIERGETQLERARKERLTVAVQLRNAGTSWPRLVALTGVSDSYLRREASRQKGDQQ